MAIGRPTGNEALGHAIRKRRHAQGMSLADVAACVTVTAQHLSDVERGRRLPSLDVLDELARALDCRVVDLLEDVPPYGRDSPRRRRA